MNCGHLRIFHAKGLPEGQFEESTEPCPYCRIVQLKERHEFKSNLTARIVALEAALRKVITDYEGGVWFANSIAVARAILENEPKP